MITLNDDFTVGADDVYDSTANEPIFYLEALVEPYTFTNLGIIRITHASEDFWAPVSGNGFNVIDNRNLIEAINTVGGARAISEVAGPIFNSGDIRAFSESDVAQAFFCSAHLQIDNSGSIIAESNTGDATAIFCYNAGSLINTGEIRATSESGHAIAFLSNRFESPLGSSFFNSGTVIAEDGTGFESVGLYVDGFGSTTGWPEPSITNAGTITADVAILGGFSLRVSILNDAGGSIFGDIRLGGDRDHLVNKGTIVGDVEMGDEHDAVNTQFGTIDGVVDLGGGTDSFTGSDEGDDIAYGGAGNDTLRGGYGDDRLDGGTGADVMRGGGGNDIYVVDDDGDWADEAGGNGVDEVNSWITYTQREIDIEIVRLLGDADIDAAGNAANNTLIGNSGDNVLDGKPGNDTMTGGDGDDTYLVYNAGDVVIETASGGVDQITTSISLTLPANVERLRMFTGAGAINGTGNELDNTLIGNGHENKLKGVDGADVLDGRGGADILDGGAGLDTASYIAAGIGLTANLANSGANTGEAAGDTFISIENLTGSDFADTLTGDAQANVLSGGAGADILNGGNGSDTVAYATSSSGVTVNLQTLSASGGDAAGDTYNSIENVSGSAFADELTGDAGANLLNGGAGADALSGGAGDDVYVVDDAGDMVIEDTTIGGADRVDASVSFALGANVENLTLLGAASINATGNTLNNQLTGNSGANILNGKEGADAMTGGDGDDVYGVDSTGDVVLESSASGGIDQVNSYVHFALGANVEKLSLRGSANLKGVGNALNNALSGNGGDNILDGKEGVDTMAGGSGNDTYGVENVGDVVKENAGAGIDQVNSYVNYTLGANVERLSLRGSADLKGAGNELDNTIMGNSGDNVLKAGLGLDFMTGGAGDDLFKFDTALSADNRDTITDFNVADDGLQLENGVFTTLSTTGMLAADAFHTGAAAHDASDRIIYDATTGALYHDADGDGAGAAIQFAQLTAGLGLTNADIFVV